MEPESCTANRTDVFNEVTDKVVGSLAITIGTLGLIGNLLVFVAVSISKKLHTTTNVFVVCLAVTDFLTSLILPLQGLGVLSGREWPLPDWTCTFVSFITLLSNPMSILTLTAIAINRYILITKPKDRYLRIYTYTNITWMLVCIWVFSFLLCVLPQLIPATGGLVYDPCFRTCIWDLNHPMARVSEAAIGVVFFICSLIISFCYLRIYLSVRSHNDHFQMNFWKIKGQRAMSDESCQSPTSITSLGVPNVKQINITKNMACVVVVFFICTMPFSIYFFTKTRSIEGAFLMLVVAAPICLNPLIYAAKHPVFKEVFKGMFCCSAHKIPAPSRCLKAWRCENYWLLRKGINATSTWLKTREEKNNLTSYGENCGICLSWDLQSQSLS